MAEAWQGVLVTLNCGHLELCDLGYEPNVGQPYLCQVCPPRVASGRDYPSATTRIVVRHEPATAKFEPARPDPGDWYWEG